MKTLSVAHFHHLFFNVFLPNVSSFFLAEELDERVVRLTIGKLQALLQHEVVGKQGMQWYANLTFFLSSLGVFVVVCLFYVFDLSVGFQLVVKSFLCSFFVYVYVWV